MLFTYTFILTVHSLYLHQVGYVLTRVHLLDGWVVGWFVTSITQKLGSRFSQKFIHQYISAQNTPY